MAPEVQRPSVPFAKTTEMSAAATLSWIQRLLARPENAFMCTVDESFLWDKFNLYGLDELVTDYELAVRTIMHDVIGDGSGTVTTMAAATAAAELLYGLVHARFVMTPRGIAKMLEKYKAGRFGYCPRVNCQRAAVLPIGLNDVPGQDFVKLYCPRCMDVYVPATEVAVDGAFFGTGFPEMVFMTRPDLRPPRSKDKHEAKIYGFRVHKSVTDCPAECNCDLHPSPLPLQ